MAHFLAKQQLITEEPMASTPDELTITYTEDGIDIVKELDKML